jgi:hypothetical protein
MIDINTTFAGSQLTAHYQKNTFAVHSMVPHQLSYVSVGSVIAKLRLIPRRSARLLL